MYDSYLEALQHYEGETLSIRKGRGAWICQWSDGSVKQLKEYRGTVRRLEFETAVLEELGERGIALTDRYVRNQDGELLTVAEDGTKYVLKEWFSDRECSLRDSREMLGAVSHIARLHQAMGEIAWRDEWDLRSMLPPGPLSEMRRHTREMKRVRTFIRNQKKKGDFERCVIAHFDSYYEEALQAQEGLEHLLCPGIRKEPPVAGPVVCHSIRKELPVAGPVVGNLLDIRMSTGAETGRDGAREEKGENACLPQALCHGDLDQHHILIRGPEAVFIEFNQMHRGIQMTDLYRFLRKCLERQDWDGGLGLAMIERYDRVRPISREERKCLYYLFLYPEKYWKQLNYYNSANKAWIPEKNVEKLKAIEARQKSRKLFLSKINL
ncbi:MAG: spore coat protein CotS [Clostridiales bacterium]|nr:spore coat protein CotS [Clostridiales bacterium]